MKRIFCLILMLCLLSGCGAKKDEGKKWTSFTDDTGYEVKLYKKPERVAVLFSSYAQVWTLAGGNVDITVQESIDRGFCDDNTIVVDSKSGHTHIDTELLIASEPDLVIGTTDYKVQSEAAELCRSAGIPVALFKVESFDDYLNMLDICAVLCEREDNYLKYGALVEEEITEMGSSFDRDGDKTKILFMRAGSSARSTKAKTKAENFVCAMLCELNTYNIAENAPILLDGLSIEEIMKEDPEHIFIVAMGDEAASKEYVTSLFKEDGWNSLTAVKMCNVHFLPKDLFHYKPNHRWAEAYRYLLNILYPETINE